MVRRIQRLLVRRGIYGGNKNMLYIGLGLMFGRKVLGSNDKPVYAGKLKPGENLVLTHASGAGRRSQRRVRRANKRYQRRLAER